MGDDRLWQRVVGWIDRELKRRKVSRERLSEELGHSENYLRRFIVETEKPRWDIVLRVLREIGAPVSVVFSTLDPKRSHEIFAGLSPDAQPPPEAKRLLSRVKHLIRVLPACRPGEHFAENLAALSDLADLEEKRFAQPNQTSDECEDRLLRISAIDSSITATDALAATGCLGIWSSIRRREHDLASARSGVILALQCAEELRSLWLEARTLQRAAFILRDFGNIAGGQLLLTRASDLYLRYGDLDGCGRTLVDRSILNYNGGACHESEHYALQALQYLAKSDWRNIAAAHWYIARCRLLREDLHGAAEALSLASSWTRAKDPSLWAFYRKCLGDILIRQGDFTEAERAYRDSLSVFRAVEDPINTTELTLALAVVLAKTGQSDGIPKLAEELRRGLKNYPEASLPPLVAEVAYLLASPGWNTTEMEEYQEKLRRCPESAL